MIKCQEDVKAKNRHAKKGWVIPLENPLRKNRLTENDLKTKVCDVLGVPRETVGFYVAGGGGKIYENLVANESSEITDRLGGKILHVCVKGSTPDDRLDDEITVNAVNFPDQP